MWAGCVAGEWAWWDAQSDSRAVIPALAVALGVTFAVLRMRAWFPRTRSLGRVVLCGLALGAVLSYANGVQLQRQGDALGESGARTWSGVVTADPAEGRFGSRIVARLGSGPARGGVVSVGWPAGAQTPQIGQVVEFRALLGQPSPGDPYLRDDLRSGMCGTGRAWLGSVKGWTPGVKGRLLAWRARQSAWLSHGTSQAQALLRGIALGDRRSLHGGVVEDDFRILGLSHVLAVSGLHLGLVCVLALALARLLHAGRRVTLIACVSAGAVFAVVAGSPVSAMRALLMVCVASVASLAGVKHDGCASLGVAVIALIVASPWSVFAVGLQLSVLAVAGLLLFGRLATAWADACALRRATAPVRLMSLTMIAQLITAVVCVPTFGMFSLLAPVANAIVLPCLPVALSCGLMGLLLRGTVLDVVSKIALWASMTVLGLIARVTAALASAPGAAIAVHGSGRTLGLICAAMCVVLWIWWPAPSGPRRARWLAALVALSLVLSALGPVLPASASITVLDVGQGDAILVRDGTHALLVDTGPSPTLLRQALARANIRRLDGIVITHEHDDHAAGMSGLTGVVRVGWVAVSCASSDAFATKVRQTALRLTPRGHVAVVSLSAGQSMTVGSTRVDVLWPGAGAPAPDNVNDTSLVLEVHWGEFSAVLTGDCEVTAQRQMLQAGLLHRVDVLKVAHHGSENGLEAQTLAAWSPCAAIISVGAGNTFGHPHACTLRLLEGAGVRIYRTDLHGDVIVHMGAHGFTVSESSVCENKRTACSRRRAPPFDRQGDHGRQESASTRTRVSHLEQRRAFARAGGHAAA